MSVRSIKRSFVFDAIVCKHYVKVCMKQKKPSYLTQCLRGRGGEIESAFEKSADILFRYFHWVMAVEACTADRQIAASREGGGMESAALPQF